MRRRTVLSLLVLLVAVHAHAQPLKLADEVRVDIIWSEFIQLYIAFALSLHRASTLVSVGYVIMHC